MKNILITGVNSYIGNKFDEWVKQWPDQYNVSKISMRNDDWKAMDWTKFDVVLHVAGIAHNSSDTKLEELYYKVNRDLTVEVAKKAKREGVSQFIYMSSIIVFGTKVEVIDSNTQPNPDNFYGDSKLQGELGIKEMQEEKFDVVIVRPPMVYGNGSKGNYPRLAKLAVQTPVFPDFKNNRSMIHIENLTEFLKVLIDDKAKGYFHPQNTEYVCTSELVREISDVRGKNIFMLSFPKQFITPLLNIGVVKKMFGNYIYDKEISTYHKNYIVNDLRQSIDKTERGDLIG
ncbi:NAD-dependent epimerase/dehydratase family protein [Ruoffia tabacinasalis]|uniref:NAD-dependent epimerase/dehydratase family protein n=1 Tax=Ruoffia tabacinasalis TaxID=87458 RepID=A0A5R9DXV7_9LACT|nr:NAD-dependent epimerase/dehydratase family protein [Ruoffia tabacinasalis]TLQ39881.1 NAD-dependent epimerase/dehydratase family protein [Ruoffia tabacinasalis]